jgi:hypothetical protein
MATWVDPMAEELDAEDDPPPLDGWRVLLEALTDRRPEWQAEAACRDADPALFFPERGHDPTAAKALCATCPTLESCKAYVIETGVRHGIWAGRSWSRATKATAA